MATFRDYLSLAKPGIILGNLISAAGGFFLGSRGQISVGAFLATLAGMALVIGGGCALNNYIDRDIDALMTRTRNRPLPMKRIPAVFAVILGLLLALCGLSVLALHANALAVGIAFSGFIVYVVLYSLWLKRTRHGTWMGSLAGAVPPLVGYCAASGRLDIAGLILFLIYAAWQFPHAYAIAILHLQDYATASIPVLPVVQGVGRVKRNMPAYVAAFTLCSLLLFFTHNTGWGYFAVLLFLGLAWMRAAWRGRKGDDRLWARKSFAYSILMVMALSLMMSVDFVIQKPDLSSAEAQPFKIAFLMQ